jgi:diacylglycerol kinase (ATP)
MQVTGLISTIEDTDQANAKRCWSLDIERLDQPAVLILNPVAGRKVGLTTNRAGADEVTAALAGKVRFEVLTTAYAGHATSLARSAVAQGRQLVIAAGGDGTVGEVAQGLAGTDVVLGILPLGSVMNVARMLGIPRDLEAAARTIAEGRVLGMDLGRVRSRYFLEAAGVGLDAGLLAYFVRADDRRLSPVRALRAALRFVRVLGMPRLLIEADGRTWHADSPLVTIANGPFAGAGSTIAPGARIDDGLLDLTVYRCVSPFRLMSQLVLRAGGWKVLPPDAATTLRVRSVRVQQIGRRRLPAHADGAAFGLTPAEFHVAPMALRVVVGDRAEPDRGGPWWLPWIWQT